MNDHEQIASLQKRISELERKFESTTKFERWAKIFTAISAIVAFSVGVGEYLNTQHEQFRQTFWQKRIELYSRACNAAANIAIASDIESVRAERQEFWSLYWGDVSVVEDRQVRDAMVNYGTDLWDVEHNREDIGNLRPLSYDLARACRESLKATWEWLLPSP